MKGTKKQKGKKVDKTPASTGRQKSAVGPPLPGGMGSTVGDKILAVQRRKRTEFEKLERLRHRLKARKKAHEHESAAGHAYVGRIGDADEFIRKLRDKELALGDFADPERRRLYEFEYVFPCECLPMHVILRAKPKHEMRVATKKVYLKQKPRFTFIGRYDFEYKRLFVLKWSLISVKGSKKRVTRFLIKNDSCYTSSSSSSSDDGDDRRSPADTVKKAKRQRKKEEKKLKKKERKEKKKAEKKAKKLAKKKEGGNKRTFMGLTLGF